MRILVATDGSESASSAVDFAARLSAEMNARLKILHVIDARDIPQLIVDYSRWEHVAPGEFLCNLSESILAKAQKRAIGRGAPKVETASLVGGAAPTILNVASHDKSDMIVLGKRGRSRLPGFLLGSVSRRVMHSAPCKVTAVP
jgi:nucleotide-binding universal stress UspA family protein